MQKRGQTTSTENQKELFHKEMAAEHICRYIQTGYCKFKNLCRYRHIEEVCDVTDCESHECLKRHPRVCRYFQFRGYCKFSDHCAYAHQERKEVKEIEILKRRLDDALRRIGVLEKNTRMLSQPSFNPNRNLN